MTSQEILEQITELELHGNTELTYEIGGEIEGIGNWVQTQQGGGEGQGDRVYVVIHFPEHDVYLRMDGTYESYDGYEWQGSFWRIVTPQQKIITVYE